MAESRTIVDAPQRTDQPPMSSRSRPNIWYCPSRWLMAHNDPQADIFTLSSSHMCLADLNNDGENLLALVDFKKRPQRAAQAAPSGVMQPPYDCRLRVYRGQQLIYNHFLDDMPSCLIATSIRGPVSIQAATAALGANRREDPSKERALLTVAINDDIYFYHKLKPSHRVSLEDDERIMKSLNKSEYDIWQMVRENKVDPETMRELLVSLSNELGSHELTSHSNNFLALETNEERKNYLLLWRFKRASNGMGEHLMSMDTICCAAARLKYNSSLTRSGDYGQTREPGEVLLGNSIKWDPAIDSQKDGLVVGTEDKHLLIYELRLTRAILETHHRLPSTPDHILVERRASASPGSSRGSNPLTYKILISCRNCRIYSIDQPLDKSHRAQVNELLALKCNVLDMCWTGGGDETSPVSKGDTSSGPSFVVACLDRRVYCFSSASGQCKWVIETELPVTCVISLPATQTAGATEDSSRLIGVASRANRIDFHLSQTGRIVDSIYFGNDYCQAMTFGRFGREDNCLCLTTRQGHLLIFILKRTAKFAHGQCLSSAASHAAAMLTNCGPAFQRQQTMEAGDVKIKLSEPPSLPTPFALAKSSNKNPTDQAIELLQAEHNCEQVLAKSTLDAHLVAPQLQVPAKSRDFVDQIVDQRRHSAAMSRVFAKHMVRLRDKIRSTIEQQSELGRLDSGQDSGNRITLSKITGLGNTYRISLSLRLNLKRHALEQTDENHHLLSGAPTDQPESAAAPTASVKFGSLASDSNPRSTNQTGSVSLAVLLFVGQEQQQQRQCQVKPFRIELTVDAASAKGHWIFEKTIEFKLLTGPVNVATNIDSTQALESESVPLDVYIMLSGKQQHGAAKWTPPLAAQRPVFISSVNIPTC